MTKTTPSQEDIRKTVDLAKMAAKEMPRVVAHLAAQAPEGCRLAVMQAAAMGMMRALAAASALERKRDADPDLTHEELVDGLTDDEIGDSLRVWADVLKLWPDGDAMNKLIADKMGGTIIDKNGVVKT